MSCVPDIIVGSMQQQAQYRSHLYSSGSSFLGMDDDDEDKDVEDEDDDDEDDDGDMGYVVFFVFDVVIPVA